MRFSSLLSCWLCLWALFCGCSSDADTPPDLPAPRFTLVSPQESGLSFSNLLTEGPNTNILMYEYFYNGGGVAAADFNLDGNIDLYFTSNLAENQLYLNRGDWKFEDVTEVSQTAGRPGPWKTGVTVVDINADDRPDLYVSYSGMLPAAKRRNQLFVNTGTDESGVPRFREAAADYGLDAPAFSNQGYFVDYDGDDDLDLLLLNHNPKSLPILNAQKTQQLLRTDDPERGLRLYRNDDGKYADVTEAANINGSPLSYGLGLALSDINGDGLPDFYLSNDYEVPDYLYINNGDGTFTDELSQRIGHTSHFSMGNDIADINNDGLPDIFTLDMLPADNHRRKLLMADDNRSRHDLNRASGFTEQTMRNMLHLNRGDGSFAEIGQLAGVSATDWSWSALLSDFDNDGWKDLHVTNGYLRDYTNMDFIKYMDDFVAARGRLQRTDVLEMLKEMPASDLSNVIFRNGQKEGFDDVTAEWGLDRPSNSNGAVAVDLDNDGDLDLAINNINQPAFLYRNETSDGNYLQVALRGDAPNTQAIGAKVAIEVNGTVQVQEYFPNRGYLSSSPPVLHFGLGDAAQVESLLINWPNGSVSEFRDIAANQRLSVEQDAASPAAATEMPIAQSYFSTAPSPVFYTDDGPGLRDFDRQALLPRNLSSTGPVMVTHDLNADGYEDLLIAGSASKGVELYLQQPNGSMQKPLTIGRTSTNTHRITDLAVADLNNDRLPDIYVAQGGYGMGSDGEFQPDYWLANQGDGRFSVAQTFPDISGPASTVAIGGTGPSSGYPLIFLGGHALPGSYPVAEWSYLLVADAYGNYQPLELPEGNALRELELVTDAAWHDLDGDGQAELIVVGEWMPVTVLSTDGRNVRNVTEDYFPASPKGWWYTLLLDDFNGDGRVDMLVGNEGRNNQYGATPESPVTLYAADQDNNGSIDPIFSYYIHGTRYPDLTRDELLAQLSGQRARYTNYASYADVTTEELESRLEKEGQHLVADRLETSLFLQNDDGIFELAALPVEAQYAPVYAAASLDADGDGHTDLILAGNETKARLRYGSSDANTGTLLRGRGDGSFAYVPQARSGLQFRGSVRSLATFQNKLMVGVREGELTAYDRTTPTK
ncbi:VCBS repeat-containing protein [Lewinella sp. IMCC34191]|uniref:VCBS repeat-containing protein n=1 Tax=Lewinella sp. IMCC34191 TaxID=2259172 RepID=UPI000E22D162|nr:VCBS repeat-containing protein [Lewinella sp. IMCC34191]